MGKGMKGTGQMFRVMPILSMSPCLYRDFLAYYLEMWGKKRSNGVFMAHADAYLHVHVEMRYFCSKCLFCVQLSIQVTLLSLFTGTPGNVSDSYEFIQPCSSNEIET